MSWFNIYFEWFFRYLRTCLRSVLRIVFGVFLKPKQKNRFNQFPWFLGWSFLEIFEIRVYAVSWVQKRLFLALKIWWRVFNLFFRVNYLPNKTNLIFLWRGWKSGESKGLGCWKFVVFTDSCGTSWLVGQLTILAAQAQKEIHIVYFTRTFLFK